MSERLEVSVHMRKVNKYKCKYGKQPVFVKEDDEEEHWEGFSEIIVQNWSIWLETKAAGKVRELSISTSEVNRIQQSTELTAYSFKTKSCILCKWGVNFDFLRICAY